MFRLTKRLRRVMVLATITLSLCQVAEARWLRRGRVNTRAAVTTAVEFSGDASAVCEQKAEIMASRCRMWHMGGSFGGGSAEGVGCSSDPDHALSICCYTGQRTCIGQAVRQGVNGMWYACKIFR